MKQNLPKITSAIINACSPWMSKALEDTVLAEDFEAFELNESTDPGKTQWDSAGFVRMPSGDWVDHTPPYLTFCIQINERKLPAKVRDELVSVKAEKLEAQQGRKVSKKEMRLLIEEAEMELLPKAFIGRSTMLVTIADNSHMIVWTTSVKRAERAYGLVMALFDQIDSKQECKLGNISHRKIPSDVFTAMVTSNRGSNDKLACGYSGVFKATGSGEKPVIRVRNRDLDSSDVQELLRAGEYQVVELQMLYDEKFFDEGDRSPDVTFTVNEGLVFKKLEFVGAPKLEKGQDRVDAFSSSVFLATKSLLMAYTELKRELGGVHQAVDVEDDEIAISVADDEEY